MWGAIQGFPHPAVALTCRHSWAGRAVWRWAPTTMVKIVSEAQMQEASQAASWGMLLGGVKYGAIGSTTMLLAHQFVPFVNRMTIPGKVFLVTGFTITGAMVYAEEALFEYHERNPPRRPQ